MALTPKILDGNLETVLARIHRATHAAGRGRGDVRLLLAAKAQTPETVRMAVDSLGVLNRELRDSRPVLVGENKVQELTVAADALASRIESGHVELHLIGHLQSNKVNAVLGAAVACVETVDSLTIAEALSTRLDRRAQASDPNAIVRDRAGAVDRMPGLDPPEHAPLSVMVQVNVSGEESKFGVAPEEAVEVALAVDALPYLSVTGLMTVGANTVHERVVREGYATLRGLRDEVGTALGRPLDLSMGMSHDLEWAIAEGATIVRVGEAIFGPR